MLLQDTKYRHISDRVGVEGARRVIIQYSCARIVQTERVNETKRNYTYISWIERIEVLSHVRKGKSKKIQTANLADDFVKGNFRIRYLHLFFDPPVGGDVRDVSLFGGAGTADE